MNKPMTGKELGALPMYPAIDDGKFFPGATLRQYAAIQAFPALAILASQDTVSEVAERAVMAADALLDELAKGVT